MASTLDFYWVEHRDRPGAAWTRSDRLGTVPVGWLDAVDHLRGVADDILTTEEDDSPNHDDRPYQPSDRAIECRRIMEAVGFGEYDRPPFLPGDHVGGTYLRIVRAEPVLHDPIAAELRYLVIHNAHGSAAVTLTTASGTTITGTLDWEDIEPGTVQVGDGPAWRSCAPTGSSRSPSTRTATRSGHRDPRPSAGRCGRSAPCCGPCPTAGAGGRPPPPPGGATRSNAARPSPAARPAGGTSVPAPRRHLGRRARRPCRRARRRPRRHG